MTCEEVRRVLHQALVKGADYEWKTMHRMVADLYHRLNETPADIPTNPLAPPRSEAYKI